MNSLFLPVFSLFWSLFGLISDQNGENTGKNGEYAERSSVSVPVEQGGERPQD